MGPTWVAKAQRCWDKSEGSFLCWNGAGDTVLEKCQPVEDGRLVDQEENVKLHDLGRVCHYG